MTIRTTLISEFVSDAINDRLFIESDEFNFNGMVRLTNPYWLSPFFATIRIIFSKGTERVERWPDQNQIDKGTEMIELSDMPTDRPFLAVYQRNMQLCSDKLKWFRNKLFIFLGQ